MRRTLTWILAGLLFLVLLWLCLFTGTVNIPIDETARILLGQTGCRESWSYIVLELRLPSTVVAILSGASLGVAGLLLQTAFKNPLAGPSILGVSTGASFGVALLTLLLPGILAPAFASIIGAALGAVAVIVMLLAFSMVIRSSVMLLIVGIMVSYLTSSAISLMNFYATQEGVHSFVIWGLGNYSGVGLQYLLLFSTVTVALLIISLFLVKPLNALLLGEQYAANVGISVNRSRNVILLVSGGLVAIVTAFCGPIAFIGLAIPHFARLVFKTSNHKLLLPAVIVTGALTGLFTLWVSALPGDKGILPLNAITPFIGVPVVLYIILNRRRINYFN